MTTALTYKVTSTILTDRYTAVMRCELPNSELPVWLSGVFGRVSDYLAREGVKPIGPPFARFTFLGYLVAAEAGFPVPREIPGDGVVEPSTLPDGPAAVATHYGHYRDAEKAYRACRAWLDDHGYEPAGPHWEVYYSDLRTEPDPARWRTDVVVPFRQ